MIGWARRFLDVGASVCRLQSSVVGPGIMTQEQPERSVGDDRRSDDSIGSDRQNVIDRTYHPRQGGGPEPLFQGLGGRYAMRHILAVANQILGGERLKEAVRERIGQGPCTLTLVVPVLPDAGRIIGDFAAEVGPGGPPRPTNRPASRPFIA